MPKNDHLYNALRMASRNIQDDPSTPEDIRVEFASVDKMQDIRDLLGDATKAILVDQDETDLKKEWLEYLSLTECGIRSFLDAHGVTIPGE